MNLTVSPMNCSGCNCPKPKMNFGQLPVRVVKLKHEQDLMQLFRERDKVADVFSALFERDAKKIGLNTDELAKKGFCLNFVPKEDLKTDMFVSVLDKEHGFMIQSPRGISLFIDTIDLRGLKNLRDIAQYNQERVMPFVQDIKKGLSVMA